MVRVYDELFENVHKFASKNRTFGIFYLTGRLFMQTYSPLIVGQQI